MHAITAARCADAEQPRHHRPRRCLAARARGASTRPSSVSWTSTPASAPRFGVLPDVVRPRARVRPRRPRRRSRSRSPTGARSGSAAASTGSTSSPDGRRVVVYDYKTGKSDDLRRHRATATRWRGGKKLQLPVYALAAEQHHHVTDAHAYYWFTRSDDRCATRRLRGRRLPRPLHRGAHHDRRRRRPRAASPRCPANRTWIPVERRHVRQLPRTATSTACARSNASRRGSARPTTT